jgi:hypothetical protein
LEEWFEQNPHQIQVVAQQAAARALAGDANAEVLLDAALVAWEDTDRFTAKRFERQFATAVAEQRARQSIQQTTSVDQEWNQAAAQLAAQYPDFDQFAPQIFEAAQKPENSDYLRLLETGSPRSKQSVLRLLYNEVKAGTVADTLHASREFAEQAAVEADRAIAEASVVSSGSATPPPVAKSADELMVEEWAAMTKPYEDGWPF